MRKCLDNLHLQNFNGENPGSMLNHEIYIPQKILGIRYNYGVVTSKAKDVEVSSTTH